jgi:uncharacterized membrane protein (DUF4010 family)
MLGQSEPGAKNPELQLRNPFEIASVLKFATVIGIVMALSKLVAATAGMKGLFALAALSGIADVDAITLSLARMAGSTITAPQAADAILIAACVNTIAKAAMTVAIAGRGTVLAVAVPSAAAVLALLIVRGVALGLAPAGVI